MRYADGGGLDEASRLRREQVRRRAAVMFAAGSGAVQVTRELEVSDESAYQWRRVWAAWGRDGLVSKGPSGPDSALSDKQLVLLRERLDAGPAAAGYRDDQRWMLARVSEQVTTNLFGVWVAVTTVWQAMRRLGCTAQMPVHRGVERDEQAIARWRRYQWPAVKPLPPGETRGSASPMSAAKP